MSNPMFLVVREEFNASAGWDGKFPEDNCVYIDHLYYSYEEAEAAIKERLPYDEDLFEDSDELPEVIELFYSDWEHDSMIYGDKYPVRYSVYRCPDSQTVFDVLISIVPVFVES